MIIMKYMHCKQLNINDIPMKKLKKIHDYHFFHLLDVDMKIA